MVHLQEESPKREFVDINVVENKFSSSSNEDKCNKILEIDDTIRFAGIATNDGQILAAKYKPGASPFFDDTDTEFLVSKQILLAMENS